MGAMLLLLCLPLSACGGDQGQTAELFAMDTVMTLTAYGGDADAALTEAQREINGLEALLSRTRPDSEISRINAAPAGELVPVGQAVWQLLDRAQRLGAATGGAFDITIAPVASAWGFTEQAYRVPSQEELAELLTHVGAGQLSLNQDQRRVSHEAGVKIDLGGIAKGYASDRVADIFARHQLPSAVVSLGGNVYVRGTKPDGKPWKVGIQDPKASERYLGVLKLTDAFAITSGGYQRYFEQNGKIYHHIIDPKTGYPADSGLTSVTVVADCPYDGQDSQNGALCDAYSTALFVMGEEKALDFWRESDGAFQLVLVTADGRVLVTAGLADKFEQEKDTGYAYEIIS